jgi:hypothetical protein
MRAAEIDARRTMHATQSPGCLVGIGSLVSSTIQLVQEPVMIGTDVKIFAHRS